ncbi:MAG TPA: amino acid ABC transporter substrate-binding protein [Methylomirabilota bacterium]|jgi:branched-chain amino acid transport system substrate-binding protein|nr:amino acid ABC transporter substrate-binding protein [Methylomirabilota bacterium]
MTSIRTTRASRWLAAVLLLALAVAAPGPSWLSPRAADGQPKEFKVGVALSLSGIFSKDAGLFKEVYDLWAETVNKAGGIKVKGTGYPVHITYYDDESSPQKSAQLIERLATSDKVDLILAGFGSSIAFAATAVAEKYKYPYISGAASANPIFERGYKYFFATLNKTFDEVEGAAKVFTQAQPKPTRAAVIGSDHLFGKLSAEGFKKFMGEIGVDLVHFEIFPLDLQDYNSLLLKVKRANPDILLVGGLFTHALRVMKATKEVDFAPKGIAFSYGPTVPDFLKEFGKDADGVIAASEWLPSFPFKDPIFGSAAQFNDTIQQKYGHPADYVQAAAAGGLVAQQTAIERLGLQPPLDDKAREALMEQLHKQDVMTLYGQVKFGADGAIVQKPPIAVQIQSGKFALVYPREVGGAQAAKLIYPLAPWRSR